MTELSWQGKYNKEGKKNAPLRIELPFQTIETVNESAQERKQIFVCLIAARGTHSTCSNQIILSAPCSFHLNQPDVAKLFLLLPHLTR